MDTQLKQSLFVYIEYEATKTGISLPTSVIRLCIKMIGNTFVWRIDDAFAWWETNIVSDVFRIAQLNWQIDLHPRMLGGLCGFFIKLLELPSSWKSIFCQLHIECPEMQIKLVLPLSYKHVGYQRHGTYISSFKDFESSCNQQLTFVITIHIARITLKEDKAILFQMATNKYRPKVQLQWKIGEEMMKQLKSFVKPKGICSDIYNDIWCLHLYPNGTGLGQGIDWEKVVISLYLCGLPANISKMSVRWTVRCHADNDEVREQTKTGYFGEESRGFWNKNTIPFSDIEFCKYNTWTISVDINVLNVFDLNGEETTQYLQCSG
eukprot:438113_1